jgi:hypothetical protein
MLRKYFSLSLLLFLWLVGVLLLAACAGDESPPTNAEKANDATVLYTENFDDGESCFDPNMADFAGLSLENGELIIEIKESSKFAWSPCADVVLDNFTFEMDVYDDTSVEGFRFFGVQLRKEPGEGSSKQYYLIRFGLGEDPTPAACAALATDNTWIANLTESPSDDSCWLDLPEPIQPGEWNHFEITANGPELTFAVNDIFVASVNDSRLSQGTIALFAGTHEADSARVKIDNIRVTALEE